MHRCLHACLCSTPSAVRKQTLCRGSLAAHHVLLVGAYAGARTASRCTGPRTHSIVRCGGRRAAYQKAVREQKLAAEISAAKRERDFYLSRVDRAKAEAAQAERKRKVCLFWHGPPPAPSPL